MFRTVLAVALTLLPALASAQWVPPDDRYQGYPRELVRWMAAPPTDAQLIECEASEYYEPRDTSIAHYADRIKHKIAGIRTQETDECAFELTAHHDPAKRGRLVLRPAGTKVAVDHEGRDLFDYGTDAGVICKNPRPYSWKIVRKLPVVAMVPKIEIPTPMRLTEQIKEGKYYEAFVPPPPTPPLAAMVEKKKSKKGWLWLIPAACVGNAIWKKEIFCGFGFGGDDEAPEYTPPAGRPPSTPTPPPNTTPVKPG